MITILFADNDKDFLNTRREYLEKQGYRVVPALNLEEARRALEFGNIDLAIIDIRLEDDDDEKDTSGLILAKEGTPTLPKIMMTQFPSYEYVRNILRPQLEGLPAAVDFIAKQEGPEAMLRAVQRALEFGSVWLQKTMDEITDQLKTDYLDARQQSRMNYWASLSVAVMGIIIIFVGTALTLWGIQAIGIVSAIGGVVTEAVSYLFFKRVDVANKRMDQYHTESLQTRRFENLLASCDEITSSERRETSKEKVIETARIYWFGFRDHKAQHNSKALTVTPSESD
ncbi:MAG: response regulator [Anaerolineales bacterium]|nr:response regulator [Anaerolineales bacterium]